MSSRHRALGFDVVGVEQVDGDAPGVTHDHFYLSVIVRGPVRCLVSGSRRSRSRRREEGHTWRQSSGTSAARDVVAPSDGVVHPATGALLAVPGVEGPQEQEYDRTTEQVRVYLFLSEKKVKDYVSNLLTKLDLESRTQAAALATRLLG